MKIFLISIFSFFSLSIMAQDGFRSPRYFGGEVAMQKFIDSRLFYPPSAWNSGIEGQVHLVFTISGEGAVENVKVLKSLHPDCDSVAVKIVRSMPRWSPGKENGEVVAMNYSLPIIFRKSMLDIEGEIFSLDDSVTSPEFPGGMDSLFRFIRENLKYPSPEPCFQGRVAIRFIVTKEGKITRPKVIKGIDPGIDEEAMRVVRLMPDWVPGRRNGEAVNVYFTIPVLFRLM